MSTNLVGTIPLVRLAARRDRLLVSIWLLVLVGICYASAAATTDLYATEAERVAAAETINASPGLVALYGPILDVHSTGELAMTKMTVTYALLVSILALFVVRRHTRVDEENGQAELLGGTAIGREAHLGAAVSFGTAVSLLLGLLAALVNVAGGLPLVGSFAFGASWAGTGLAGVGITALACQLSASARTCAGIAAAVIGAMFVLRAVGDTSSASFLSWLSPFGWNTQLRAYSDTRWWVLFLYVGLAGAFVLVAKVVHDHRDLGAGVIKPRPGPANGSPRLRDAVGLAVRVHAPTLAWWTLAMAALGLVFGAISPSFDNLDSEQLRQLFERIGGAGTFRDMLLAAVASVVALIVTCFGIVVVGHGGSDEQDGRTEQVLATATTRTRVLAATTLVAVAGATWLLLVAGVALAIGVGGGSTHSLGMLVVSVLGQAPAVWVVLGAATLLLASDSRATPVAWGVLVLCITLGLIGELLGLPEWVLQASPYSHVPKMPVEPFAWAPAIVLAAVAALLLGVAFLRYRARDIG